MTCVKCNNNLTECECPDAPERIRSILESPYIFFPPEHKQRLLDHAKKLEEQKALAE